MKRIIWMTVCLMVCMAGCAAASGTDGMQEVTEPVRNPGISAEYTVDTRISEVANFLRNRAAAGGFIMET